MYGMKGTTRTYLKGCWETKRRERKIEMGKQLLASTKKILRRNKPH